MCERTADHRIRTTEWEEIQYKHGNKIGQYEHRELEIVAQKLADRHADAPLVTHDAVRERARERQERNYVSARNDDDDDDDDGDDDGGDAGTGKATKSSRSGAGGASRVCEDLVDEDRDMAAAALEGEDDEEDILRRFRAARVKALQEQAARDRFGRVRAINGASYITEITQASGECWVVGALVEQNDAGCLDLLDVLEAVAARHPHIKFVTCKSTEAIPNFPRKHLPCVVMYSGGAMQAQVTGMEPWCKAGGTKPSVDTVETGLRRYRVLPPKESAEGDD